MAPSREYSALVLIVALLALSVRLSDAAGRTIRIPLARKITQGIGAQGQPVINYLTTVNIGTPPKPFAVQFDVNLSDHFVPHYNWNPFKTNLHYSSGFQCKSSSSCIKNDRQMQVDYMRCILTGKPYEDKVTFGSAYATGQDGRSNQSSVLMSFRQNFLAISDASDSRFSSYPIDGFFGLGPQTQSAATCNNLLVSMHSNNLIDNLQFSLWFNPVLDSNQGGELMLGGADTSKYQGQVYWHRLSGVVANRWALNLQQVSLGNQAVSCLNAQCQAVLSSGVNEIYGPREDVQRIYSMLSTSHQASGIELVDCRRLANLPTITFHVDGIPYALLPSNYVRKMESSRATKDELCYVSILPADNSKEWVLGTNFMGAYYNIFDITYRQVGFAALR